MMIYINDNTNSINNDNDDNFSAIVITFEFCIVHVFINFVTNT